MRFTCGFGFEEPCECEIGAPSDKKARTYTVALQGKNPRVNRIENLQELPLGGSAKRVA